MKYIQKAVLLISTLALLTISCSKEDINNKTEGEINGEKIKEFCQKEQIKAASTYLIEYRNGYPYASSDEWNEAFIIDGPIIKVGETFYNLSKLVKYEIYLYQESKILLLYFEGFTTYNN